MLETTPNNTDSILAINEIDQYHTVDEVLEHSRPNSIYYTLLIVSSLIIACGLLLNNGFIIIGGILVAPVLNPLLTVALGITVGEVNPIKKMALLLSKTCLIVITVAGILSLLFGTTNNMEIFDNTMRTAILYFIVALSSGVAATFALVRKDLSEVVTGTALAVSLIPPLSLVGIFTANLNIIYARYYLLIFILNVIGIIIGSLIVFSLLKFYKTAPEVIRKSVN